MKIKKLEPRDNGCYEYFDIVNKLNEIIDFLNNSFITQDPDCIQLGSLSNTSCDRLTPLTNETTCELTIDHIDNMIDGGGIYHDIKCPKCGAKYFIVGPSVCTAVYYPPIIKDGVNINPNRNQTTTSYTCCECNHSWEE